MDASTNAHLEQANVIIERVWFGGTTALKEGQGLCYNWNYGTAATREGSRRNRVELPATANAEHFAGVASQAYTASSTGRFIDIYKPGSTCNILCYADVVIGVGIVTCEAGNALSATYAGYFSRSGFEGEGSATPLQTISGASTAALCLAYLHKGKPSGLIEVITPPATGALMTLLPFGITFLQAATIASQDATAVLADGTIMGQRKAYQCEGTMTTNQVDVTITTGKQEDYTTALAGIVYDADAEDTYLSWNGLFWIEVANAGADLSNS